MKIACMIAYCVMSLMVYADRIKFLAVVIDDFTQEPMKEVCVGAGFTTDNGPVWGGQFKYEHKQFFSDENGMCKISGDSNCGKAGCYIKKAPAGYYKAQRGIPMRYKKKNIFGVWQPDNLVVTIKLQRVEHPIPLFIKNFFKDGNDYVDVDYFGKGGGKMQLDLIKGDWLPPLGNGEFSDVVFTRLEREDLGMGTTFRGSITAPAYKDSMSIRFTGEDNGLVEVPSKKTAGIKIRTAPEIGYTPDYLVTKGRDKNVKYFSSSNPDRNFAFRIRTKRDKDGRIVSAYYGKIYGDIEIKKFSYGLKVPVATPAFLYYLNPTPLDRNLEWDMKTNLCPNPGSLVQKQP